MRARWPLARVKGLINKTMDGAPHGEWNVV
jgi:hypothetical protein